MRFKKYPLSADTDVKTVIMHTLTLLEANPDSGITNALQTNGMGAAIKMAVEHNKYNSEVSVQCSLY